LPLLQAAALGLLLVGGFALAPLERLRRVPPLRMLRGQEVAFAPAPRLYQLAAIGTLAGVVAAVTGEWRMAAGFAGALAGFATLTGTLAWLLLRAMGPLAARLPGSDPALAPARHALRLAMVSVGRRARTAAVQVLGLGLGLLALLLLVLVRADLFEAWRAQVPADAPNRFIINVQPEQAGLVQARLAQLGLGQVRLEPMVRGRLVAIDGREVHAADYAQERDRALVEREFNLTARSDLPAHNPLVGGRWFETGSGEASVEEGIAGRLGIGLGQMLRFDVGGTTLEARVTSLRKVNWDSMRVNFFVILAPPLPDDAARTYITAVRIGPAQEAGLAALVHEMPNLTVIDIGQLLGQFRDLLGRLGQAVELLFSLALAAGVAVLVGALLAGEDERAREAALLRALGASRARIAWAQRLELAIIGTLAGLLAAGGATLLACLLAHQAFEFDFTPRPWVLGAGLALGNLAALAGGALALRRVLARSPVEALRAS
jgi:putative ABC transport system permease protein